ncbi:MAG TPA: hypothetical protein VJB35_05780 [Candidatus Nanoarchaeia archaeon]|nr:hypothetical protein [Candidatus Nanoarchaeia archaeon]
MEYRLLNLNNKKVNLDIIIKESILFRDSNLCCEMRFKTIDGAIVPENSLEILGSTLLEKQGGYMGDTNVKYLFAKEDVIPKDADSIIINTASNMGIFSEGKTRNFREAFYAKR